MARRRERTDPVLAMVPLFLGVCLAGAGSIVSVFVYLHDLEKDSEKKLQIVTIGMVGVGATLSSWSTLHKAGEQGLFLPIVTWFVLVIVVTYGFVRRNRRVATTMDTTESESHGTKNNSAITTPTNRERDRP